MARIKYKEAIGINPEKARKPNGPHSHHFADGITLVGISQPDDNKVPRVGFQIQEYLLVFYVFPEIAPREIIGGVVDEELAFLLG